MIPTLHIALSAGFVLVTTGLLCLTLVNRLRVRNVQLSWRPARKRFPIAPLLFMGAVVALEVVGLATGRMIPLELLAAYGVGSAAWAASVWMSNTVLINECGVMTDVHSSDGCLPWGRVSDYFEYDHGDRRGVVLLYTADAGQRRLELEVPDELHSDVLNIVDSQLRIRVRHSDRRTQDKTALEG